MVIHTFGNYARFNPHLHAIVADGLFRKNGTFYVLPKSDMKQLEKYFVETELKRFWRESYFATTNQKWWFQPMNE